MSTHCSRWSLIDIGVNLTDGMFAGVYNGRQRHKKDIEAVLDRAALVGVRGMLLTGSNVKESQCALEQCKTYSSDTMNCLCTVGCHPTYCSEFTKDPDAYYTQLDALIQNNKDWVVAVGEIGLDYDRLHFCSREVQLQFFERQLDLAEKHKLPLFLHDRNSGGDFYKVIAPNRARLSGGVIHSFTGTQEELELYLSLNFYIGVNGCSLKTQDNLRVVQRIPLDRLMIETDAPWCDLRPTHASKTVLEAAGARQPNGKSISSDILEQFPTCKKEKYVAGAVVRGRCEPANLVQVLEVLYELHRDEVSSIEELADRIERNTRELFPFDCGRSVSLV